jgi:hypothetical protein
MIFGPWFNGAYHRRPNELPAAYQARVKERIAELEEVYWRNRDEVVTRTQVGHRPWAYWQFERPEARPYQLLSQGNRDAAKRRRLKRSQHGRTGIACPARRSGGSWRQLGTSSGYVSLSRFKRGWNPGTASAPRPGATAEGVRPGLSSPSGRSLPPPVNGVLTRAYL